MKSILCVLIALLLGPWGHAQSVLLSYQDTHIGRNMSAVYTWGKRHQFYGGVKYHINRLIHDNQSNIFHKRFYASHLGEHLGLQAGYQWRIPLSSFGAILPFYHSQFTVAGTNGRDLVPSYSVISFDQLKALEQFVGLAAEAGLGKGFFVDARIGGGVVLYWDIPSEAGPNTTYVGPSSNWELGGMVSVGIGYRWGKTEP
ncbi:MAG: hypothetical protein AAF399_30490 [Bacteroidota bacterium]